MLSISISGTRGDTEPVPEREAGPGPFGSVRWSRTPGVRLLSSLERRRSAFSRVGSLPSSEAEAWGAVEGFGGEPSSEAEITPRVRVGCGRAALAYVGRVLDFFESFPFFQIRRGLQAFADPVAQHAFIFRAILVP